MEEKKSEINDFLYKFKYFAENISCFVFVTRDKNMQILLDLNMTVAQALQDVIFQLTYLNYVEGPLADEKYADQGLYVFGFLYNEMELYIKLSDSFKHNYAKCLSFHKAEYKLKYPFKEDKEDVI
ncbi:MAG: hypothetical protein KAJ18_07790 [Candidatus Omnitrophica bacterium]|nr:hypothetical protein [Candidatus Omnitrophota bacterium]